MKEVFDILSTDLLRSILNSKRLKINQLNAFVSLLIKANIRFVLSFTPATPTTDASAAVTITLRPNVTISIAISFDGGEMIMD